LLNIHYIEQTPVQGHADNGLTPLALDDASIGNTNKRIEEDLSG
jgi:hypothetical protein